MKRRVHTTRPESRVDEVARLMKTEQVSCLPVCDDSGRPLGVVTDRDIVLRGCTEDFDLRSTPVSQLMTPNPVHCHPEDTLDHAEGLMLRHRVRRILVIDAGGKLAGLIAFSDIAQYQEPQKVARWLREMSAHRFRVER